MADNLVFVGGPYDGREMQIVYMVNRLTVPVPADIYTDIEEGSALTDVSIRVAGAYTAAVADDGYRSRDDRGRLVYLWNGDHWS